MLLGWTPSYHSHYVGQPPKLSAGHCEDRSKEE